MKTSTLLLIPLVGWGVSKLAKTSGDKPKPLPQPDVSDSTRGAALLDLLEQAEVPQDWRRPLMAIAWRESRWNPAKVRDTKQERAAATKLYKRNKKRFACSGVEAQAYTFGSGGYFGFLPGTAVASAKDDCGDPRTYVFKPSFAVVSAIGYARWLAQSWERHHDNPMTPLVLMQRWGSPGRSLAKIEKLRPRAEKNAVAAVGTSQWLDDGLKMSELPTLDQARSRLGL